MRCCVTLPIGGPCADPQFLLTLAQRAESAGWDGVFLEDYVFFHGHPRAPTCDPWAVLAALAVSTSRVILGTKVTPLTRRRPWNVARQAATIDQLSGGRMVLGVGLGDVGDHVGRDASFTHLGEETNAIRRATMLDESLVVIAGLWSGEPFSFHGAFFTVDEVQFKPLPVQRPRIPIWVGGGYPQAGPTARAARWDGSMLYRADGGELTAQDVSTIRSAAGDRPYDTMVGLLDADGQRRSAAELELLEAAGATWASVYVPVAEPDEMQAAVQRGPR